MKNHENQTGTMNNQPGTMKNHENSPGTIKNQPGTMINHKNQPGIVQGGYGWLQVVTGDSKEEVIIFRDRQTDRQNLPIIYRFNNVIIIIAITSIIGQPGKPLGEEHHCHHQYHDDDRHCHHHRHYHCHHLSDH